MEVAIRIGPLCRAMQNVEMGGMGYQSVLDALSKPSDDGGWAVFRANPTEERPANGSAESVVSEHGNTLTKRLMI